MKFHDNYPLKPFQQRDIQKLRRVIKAYPLATIISGGEDIPAVSQVPLILDAAGEKLLGHFDRNNPHCARILAGGNIYCTFNGPNHYMSPAIYPDTQFPGWNYVTVHVEGVVRPIDDVEWLTDLLLRTAASNEPPDSPYRLLPTQKNFDVFIKLILGFEIAISDIRGIFKLAQDKGADNAELARRHLSMLTRRDVGAFLRELLE